MANAYASRMISLPRSTAAWPRSMTARPRCCTFTSRGFESGQEVNSDGNAEPIFSDSQVPWICRVDGGRDRARFRPGRSGKKSHAADPPHTLVRGGGRGRHNHPQLLSEKI